MLYPICSVVAVLKMLVRILNTLPSRIWDIVFFLFSDYLNLQSVRMGILQKSITFQELKFQETDIYRRSSISSVSLLCYFLLRKNEAFSAKSQNTILIAILFFIIVFLQFSIKFCFSGCLFLILNNKLVISLKTG